MIREDFFRMIWETYGIEPDYPFAGDFETAVFRRKDNLKWFAISMSVASEKIGIGAFGDWTSSISNARTTIGNV